MCNRFKRAIKSKHKENEIVEEYFDMLDTDSFDEYFNHPEPEVLLLLPVVFSPGRSPANL